VELSGEDARALEADSFLDYRAHRLAYGARVLAGRLKRALRR
jgi:hypothetical protein